MHVTTFEYLSPTTEQLGAMREVRDAFKAVVSTIETQVPTGRYRSLALTALEEAAMWANKGVTRDSDGTPRVGTGPDGEPAPQTLP